MSQSTRESTPSTQLSAETFLLFEKASCFGLNKLVYKSHGRLGVFRKILLLIGVAWLVPAILASVQGIAWGPTRAQSFLRDPAIFARFLIALPMLLLSQDKVSSKLQAITGYFLAGKLVKTDDRERFTENMRSATRSAQIVVVDYILLGIAGLQTLAVYYWVFPTLSSTWRMIETEGQRNLSLAAWWFLFVSQPLYGVILLRFIYRLCIWWRFLWKTSRLDLNLDAGHPDRVAGLSFLGMSLRSFKEAAFAISASLAGGLANVVLESGSRVTSFQYEIGAVLALNVVLFAGPLMFFYRLLVKTKYSGTLEYWALWQRQIRQFKEKWMASAPERADMLGIADFSEATDLSSILERVHQMSVIPISRKQILPLAIASVLPFLPVLALEIPMEELLQRLLKMAIGA